MYGLTGSHTVMVREETQWCSHVWQSQCTFHTRTVRLLYCGHHHDNCSAMTGNLYCKGCDATYVGGTLVQVMKSESLCGRVVGTYMLDCDSDSYVSRLPGN